MKRALFARAIRAALLFCISGLSVLVILLAGEGYARLRLVSPEVRARGAETLWRAYGNSFIQPNNGQDADCSWEESLTPHPYLGWVFAKIPPCNTPMANNIGMPDSRNFPMERDPNFYSVVLVGGSVASLMNTGYRNWLESALTERFVSPTGKPFRVFSGAQGAWSYPAQLNFLLLYGQGVDAVVALDGYNEMKPAQFPITWPATNLFLFASRPARLGWQYGAVLSLRHLRDFALSWWPLRNSFLAYFAFQGAVESARSTLRERSFALLDRYFSFPEDWPDKKRDAWNREKYRGYILQLKALAEVGKMNYAHFVQPMAQLGKELTAAEKAMLPSQAGSREYYQKTFVEPSEDLAKKGVNTFSLVNVFRQEKGTIYVDQVHYLWHGGDSRGYEIVAGEMAERIGRAWHLRRKSAAKK